MDNNQQTPTVVQPAVSDKITEGSNVDPTNADGFGIANRELWDSGFNYTDLGVNEAKRMAGNSVQSPLSGTDVSMTTGQPYGGPIVTTEVQPNVRNEAGPY